MSRRVLDFGDGGAFPEIHVVQYPLDMGRSRSSNPGSKILAVSVDAIVKQGGNAERIVYWQYEDLIPKFFKNEEDEDDQVLEKKKQIEETTRETKAAYEKIVIS